MKRISIFTLAVIMSFNVLAKPQKPIPICVNIYELTAYKITEKFVDVCNAISIRLDFERVANHMEVEMREGDAFSCNTACWLMSGTKDMASCVEDVQVNPFVASMMKNIHRHGVKSSCATAKAW